MHQRQRRLADRGPARPPAVNTRTDLGLVGSGSNRDWMKPSPTVAGIGDKLQRRHVDVVDAHLAVADHSVASKLESGEFK